MNEKLKVGDIAFLDSASNVRGDDKHNLTACEIVGYRVRPKKEYILKELAKDHNINGSFTDNYFEHELSDEIRLLSVKDTLNGITKGTYTKFNNNSFVALAVLQTELDFENVKDKDLDSMVKNIAQNLKKETKALSLKSEAMRKWNEGAVFQTQGKLAQKLKQRREDRER